MAFTPQEKVEIRRHLGYLNVQQAQTFALGIPQAQQTQFIIEGAMNLILPEAEAEARRLIAVLNSIEAQILGDQELLAVNQVDELKIRPDEFMQLLTQYDYWRRGLANVFGVMPNPWDQRFGSMSGIGSINVSVTS